MKRVLIYLSMALCIANLVSCKEYLNQKPTSDISAPQSKEDLWAIINNTTHMNKGDVALAEIGADNYFLLDAGWSGLAQETDRLTYLWESTPAALVQWYNPYRVIAYANTIIDHLDVVNDEAERRKLEGAALFFRARNYYNMMQVFSVFYRDDTADMPGIIYRKSGDVGEDSEWLTLKQSYDFLFNQFTLAANLLPESADFPTHPSKSAAFSMLSNLSMERMRYRDAFVYADSAIYYCKADFLDYNSINVDAAVPFTKLNQEVVFYSLINGGAILAPTRAKVSGDLYTSYDDEDLRKKAFFRLGADGYYAFKGNYDGNSSSGSLFSGITIAELYLQRAEAAVRDGDIDQAVADLQYIMSKRRVSGTPLELSHLGLDEIIQFVMDERRKELVFRGRRWNDLRRSASLNSGEINLHREIEGKIYTLTAEQLLNFKFDLPERVMER